MSNTPGLDFGSISIKTWNGDIGFGEKRKQIASKDQRSYGQWEHES